MIPTPFNVGGLVPPEQNKYVVVVVVVVVVVFCQGGGEPLNNEGGGWDQGITGSEGASRGHCLHQVAELPP